MGFSVSASFAIFMVGLLMLSTVAYSSVSRSMGLVREGRIEENNRMRDVLQTDINITNVSYISGNLTVEIENTGSITLDSSETDLLLNGTVCTENMTLSLAKAWIPEKTLTLNVKDLTGKPSRVKVVTENGISDYWEE